MAATTMVAGALVLAHSITWDIVRYDDGTFTKRTGDLVAAGPDAAGLFRASLLLDMLGSYLLLIPAAIYMWRLLRERREATIDLATAAGVVYASVGGAVAAALAVSGESLIRDYAAAGPAQRHAISVTFDALVTSGVTVWQTVVIAAGATWWILIGRAVRAEWRWFGTYSIVFGAVAAVAALGRVIGLDYDTTAPATPVFSAIGVWGFWLGVLLWRRPV